MERAENATEYFVEKLNEQYTRMENAPDVVTQTTQNGTISPRPPVAITSLELSEFPRSLRTRTVVWGPNKIHARSDVPLDNQKVQIWGIRWLLQQEERRIGKSASSLVIYLAKDIDIRHGLRLGRKIFRTTAFDWNM